MDTITILRELWRRRLALAIAGFVALLAGTLVLYDVSFPGKFTSRTYTVGVATTNILVDTPSSQVVDVAPRGSDTLGVRANLLASLMVDGVVKNSIATNAGLNPNDLVGISKTATEDAGAQPKDPRAPVLTTQVATQSDGSDLPIIEVQAQAGDAATAGKLAGAAVTGLRDYLNTTAGLQRIPDAHRLQVTGLGVPQAQTAERGPSGLIAFVVMIFVFGLGCACILGVSNLMRKWRDAGPYEEPSTSAPDRPDDDRRGGWVAAPAGRALIATRPPRPEPPAADDEPQVRTA